MSGKIYFSFTQTFSRLWMKLCLTQCDDTVFHSRLTFHNFLSVLCFVKGYGLNNLKLFLVCFRDEIVWLPQELWSKCIVVTFGTLILCYWDRLQKKSCHHPALIWSWFLNIFVLIYLKISTLYINLQFFQVYQNEWPVTDNNCTIKLTAILSGPLQ